MIARGYCSGNEHISKVFERNKLPKNAIVNQFSGKGFSEYNSQDSIDLAFLNLKESIDMVYERADGILEIYDWKRCKEIVKGNSWGKYGTNPIIEHLPDTNFWHYSLQLNTYKYMLEKNYGNTIGGMYLVCLHPENKNKSYIKFAVPTLDTEIKDLFSDRYLDLCK